MNVKIDITYSIEDALKELGKERDVQPGEDILVLNAEDKFFIGGGCETRVTMDGSSPQNVSVCMDSPLI